MKIAIVFLLLGFSSFIGQSSALNLRLLPKSQYNYHVRCLLELHQRYEYLLKTTGVEKTFRTKCLVEDILHYWSLLTLDIGCNTEQLLTLLELPSSLLLLIQANDIDKILEIVAVEKLLQSTGYLLQGLFAKVGLVLKTLLSSLAGLLNYEIIWGITYTLLDSISLITKLITGTILGNALGALGSILGLGTWGW